MTEKLKGKSRPAGIGDKLKIGYTHIATNDKKTELRTGEGQEFDNNALLEMLGFKEENGIMKLSASSNTVKRDKRGKVIAREVDGRILTGKEPEEREVG